MQIALIVTQTRLEWIESSLGVNRELIWARVKNVLILDMIIEN